MDLDVPGLSGLMGSVRGMADNAFGSVLGRVELLSADLQTEKNRAVQTLLWTAVLIFSGMVALAFLSGALVLATWATAARPFVIVGLGALYTGAAGYAAYRVRKCLRETKPFAGTLAQLQADRDALLGKS